MPISKVGRLTKTFLGHRVQITEFNDSFEFWVSPCRHFSSKLSRKFLKYGPDNIMNWHWYRYFLLVGFPFFVIFYLPPTPRVLMLWKKPVAKISFRKTGTMPQDGPNSFLHGIQIVGIISYGHAIEILHGVNSVFCELPPATNRILSAFVRLDHVSQASTKPLLDMANAFQLYGFYSKNPCMNQK